MFNGSNMISETHILICTVSTHYYFQLHPRQENMPSIIDIGGFNCRKKGLEDQIRQIKWMITKSHQLRDTL